MDSTEKCDVKANLRENKVLDIWFYTVSINTLPIYENDTQNSPIKYYLSPCICVEVLRLTLWSLSRVQQAIKFQTSIFPLGQFEYFFFIKAFEVPWKHTYSLIKSSKWFKKKLLSWKNSSDKSNVPLM